MRRMLLAASAIVMMSGCTNKEDPAAEASEPVSTTPVESFSQQCSYFNSKTSKSYTGQCLQTWFEDGRNEIVGGGFTFKFPSGAASQGPWMTTTLNGKPAVRYEINRDKYSYATLDLTEFLDVE